MEFIKYLDLSHLTFTQWGIFLFFSLVALFLIIKIALLFRVDDDIKDSKKKLHSAILTGLYGAGVVLSSSLALLIIFWSNLGIKEAIFISLTMIVCAIPPLIPTLIIGAYIQFIWADKLKGVYDSLVDREVKRLR